MEPVWHAESAEAVAAALATDPLRGLSAGEAARRRSEDGPNQVARGATKSPFAILAQQFQSFVIWLLIGAAVVSIALGELLDGGAILAIVVVNAAIGFFQEHRAERAMAALSRLTAPRARVVRDGGSVVIPAADVVRGDVLVIEAGDLVAADARLVEASALRTNEAPLTGEPESSAKQVAPIAPESALGDRSNLLFLGTSVASGSGRALVVATGMRSEVGRIARLVESASSGETPLQRKLDRVGRQLVWACLAIVLLVFFLGWLRGDALFGLVLGAVGLAVAAVPEGLPAVVTVALALGVERMAQRRALVRRLPSVETLGSAQVICTDKTGTLTVGEMTVRKLVSGDAAWRVTGEGYAPNGAIFDAEGAVAPISGILRELLRVAAGCNEAELRVEGGEVSIAGDPTEAALLTLAAKGDVVRDALEGEEPRLRTVPFDSDRKRMSVVRRRDGEPWVYTKGAPEVILERCTRVLTDAGAVPLDGDTRARLREACTLLAADALRVLAFAARRLTCADEADVEQDLTFVGLAGLQDPPRAEARDAVESCRRAGISVVMITGDHPATARAIAAELGILGSGDDVAVGPELERMDEAELHARVERIRVYARVTAEQKLLIVRAWKARGFVVAMTGDGVNDAPALREASIGIAMGLTGTEVAKEASDMVITDDNFASIVAAVEEGRGIFDNIRKTLSYLLAGNAGELSLTLGAVLAGYPFPLLPIQLLWINLVTDGLPALALATDRIDSSVLSRPPRERGSELADRSIVARIALVGSLTAGVAFVAFAFELRRHDDLEIARNAAFSTLVFAELFRSFGARSETRGLHELGIFSNLRLLVIVAASIAIQLSIHYSETLSRVFGTKPASLAQCATWIALGLLPLLVLEAWKGLQRARP